MPGKSRFMPTESSLKSHREALWDSKHHRGQGGALERSRCLYKARNSAENSICVSPYTIRAQEHWTTRTEMMKVCSLCSEFCGDWALVQIRN